MNASEEHLLIAANPKSGAASSRNQVTDLKEALVAQGYCCEIITSLEQVRQQSVRLHHGGNLRAVISAGGDGTADALANLLPPDIPLLIFPLGTENLLAKHLGLTGDVRDACETIQAGRRLALDVGKANGQLFLVMLSCGFDAEVVRSMHSMRTGHINRWSYTRPILSSLGRYSFPQLPFAVDDETPGAEAAAWLFVFNVPRYAAQLDFCPQADPTDGALDLCTFAKSGIGWGVGYLSRLWFGSHQSMRGFQHRRCRKLTIAAPTDRLGNPLHDIPYQIDGDPGGVLPLEIEVLPHRLTLLTPATP